MSTYTTTARILVFLSLIFLDFTYSGLSLLMILMLNTSVLFISPTTLLNILNSGYIWLPQWNTFHPLFFLMVMLPTLNTHQATHFHPRSVTRTTNQFWNTSIIHLSSLLKLMFRCNVLTPQRKLDMINCLSHSFNFKGADIKWVSCFSPHLFCDRKVNKIWYVPTA